MKNLMILLGASLLGLSMGCQKNDDSAPMEIALQNEPPLPFNLVDVPNRAEGVDVIPTLSWESAKNPKGAEVAYDLYLDTDVNPTTLLQSDIADISFELSDRLYLLTDYYWKVVAKDIDAKTSQTSIQKFTTRSLNNPNEAVTEDTNFTPRIGHTATAFKNQLWMIGGYDGDWKKDIWSSNDGGQWTEVVPTVSFEKRAGHTTTVFNDKLWVIGGYDGNAAEIHLNDVWSSSDGVNWELATAAAAFPERDNHSAVVFDNKLWIIGGDDDGLKRNDVWFTSNGTDWEMATDATAFSKRSHHTSLVFDNKIWVIGGYDGFVRENDAWYSIDGINWIKVNTTSPYSERIGQTCTVFGNKIWMLGGFYWDGIVTEAMYSSDGVSWEGVAISEIISERGFHAATVLEDKLWIIGGQNANPEWQNDVWALD